jgi:hypothetical protein
MVDGSEKKEEPDKVSEGLLVTVYGWAVFLIVLYVVQNYYESVADPFQNCSFFTEESCVSAAIMMCFI